MKKLTFIAAMLIAGCSGNITTLTDMSLTPPTDMLTSDSAAQPVNCGAGRVPNFGPVQQISSSTGQIRLLSTDFNNDKIPDLIVVAVDGTLTIRLGLGSGVFGPPLTVPAKGNFGIGDFNGDAIEDLVINVSTGVAATSGLYSYRGDGHGNFILVSEIITSIMGAITTYDINGDGKLDFLAADARTPGTLTPFMNNGNVFLSLGAKDAGNDPIAVIAGDFNHDHVVDAIALNGSGNSFTVILSLTDPVTTYQVGTSPVSLAGIDVNKDGALDVVTINQTSSDITIRFGDGKGGFGGPPQTTTIALANLPYAGVAYDLNADGYTDLIVPFPANLATNSPGGFTYLLGDGQSFKTGSTFSMNHYPQQVAVDDFNQDGLPDVIQASFDGNLAIRFGVCP